MARAASKAALARAIAAMDAAGLGVASIVIMPGGEVRIIPGPKLAPGAASLTEPGAPREVDDLDSWRERKNGRRAAQGT